MGESTVYQNALELESMLGEYRLKSVLGVGGFGMTYLAWDSNLEKQVAIKEYLPGDLAVRALDGSVVPVSTDHRHDYQWGLERFIQEARTLARFSHPHIVRVNRYFESNGTGYMVMDYEEGESLNQLLKRSPLLTEAELRRILLPLLDGLAEVHAEKFLHRDIKPSNIFMRANGSPVLLDFGAARATGGGTRSLTAVLTPGYAPLEQYGSEGKQGPWSDIYAMGGVMFRAVAGRNPPDAVSRLQGDTVKEGLAAGRGRYSAPLLRAIEWAMAVQAEQRPQSVAEWKAAFDAQGAAPAAGTVPATADKATTLRVTSAAAARSATGPTMRSAAPAAPDHSGAWRRVGWALFWIIVLALVAGWYKRRPADPPEPPPLPASHEKPLRAPVKVEVVPVPLPPSKPGDPVLPADIIEVRPVAPPRPAPGAETAAVPIPERARARVAEEFRGADRDGDGYLAPNEVEGRFPVIARDFAGVDSNGDRRISLDEFTELRRRQFESKPR